MGTKKKAGGGGGFSHCKYKGCKSNVSKFEFCPEHFDQFKFGLITKTGEHAADFEKKLEHWERHKTKSA